MAKSPAAATPVASKAGALQLVRRLIVLASDLPHPQRRLTAAEIVKVLRRYQRGATVRELAAEFHVNPLTEEVALMYAAGSSLAQVAKKCGCVPSTIRNILLRRGCQVRPRPNMRVRSSGEAATHFEPPRDVWRLHSLEG
jgi:hypothetical protein